MGKKNSFSQTNLKKIPKRQNFAHFRKILFFSFTFNLKLKFFSKTHGLNDTPNNISKKK